MTTRDEKKVSIPKIEDKEMKAWHYLAAFLVLGCVTAMASAADQITLSVYVHEGDLNGSVLSGVQVSGQDASGNTFEGTTDSNGIVTITGQPGTWSFAFEKKGYETLYLNYDATESEETAAYLEESSATTQDVQDQVELTVYVHEGSLDGNTLSDVQISGMDGEGDSIEAATDKSGSAVIKGAPGTWQFSFERSGYEPLYLTYDATQTEAVAAYLEKSA